MARFFLVFFFCFSFSSRFFLFIPAFVPLHLLPLSLAETSECVSLFFSFFPPPLFSLCDADYFVPHLWRNLRRQHCIHALIQPRRQRRALQQIRVTCLAGEASKPASKGGAAGEFSSPGSTFCADSYFGIRPTPVLPQ